MHPLGEYDLVQTEKSALAFDALSNDSGTVLVNVVEPKGANASKSPMQRFLDHHHGNGVQHVALEVDDIFAAVRAMRQHRGGLGFMPRPSSEYYRCVLRCAHLGACAHCALQCKHGSCTPCIAITARASQLC